MNFQIIQTLGFAIWILSVVITLFWIQRSNLEDQTKAIWALTVLLIPILGAIAFIIVHRLAPSPPSEQRSD